MFNLTHKQLNGRIASAFLYLSRQLFLSSSFKMILTRNELANFTAMSTDKSSSFFAHSYYLSIESSFLITMSSRQILSFHKDYDIKTLQSLRLNPAYAVGVMK